ncbi:inorganic phosphate transporter [Streptomyces sp. RKAG293]|uniref:inorganic phosphate transporter n=1 Tax=Streptomyces sp. RKAG293 TaxID=2893403 RepID=UPI0020333C8E|nr:inorganic phosphate transporter [Streptomyces sp. RKAG293]MCM2416755.1 inorganic phosphate transporter [Streptomyces sp. RKAG293]
MLAGAARRVALVPADRKTWQIMILVAAARVLGTVNRRHARAQRLGEGVVKTHHKEGFLANLTAATLVGRGAGYGRPMSTAHVSTGVIAGTAGPDLGRLSGRTLSPFLLAGPVTPFVAKGVAALVAPHHI